MSPSEKKMLKTNIQYCKGHNYRISKHPFFSFFFKAFVFLEVNDHAYHHMH